VSLVVSGGGKLTIDQQIHKIISNIK